MSKLEAAAKRVLPQLVSGTRSHRDLSVDERFIISRWAAKTAVVLNLATDFDRLWPEHVPQSLARSPLTLPDGVFVLSAQHTPTLATSWLQTGGVDFLLSEVDGPAVEDREALSRTGARIGIQVGALCLVIVHWPQPQWPLAIWPDLHEPLWPPDDEFRAIEHRFDGEQDPLAVDSRLFLYRAMETVGATRDGLTDMRIAVRKNRAPHVSGPEPRGRGERLPIPSVVTPEVDAQIREWLARNKQERAEER